MTRANTSLDRPSSAIDRRNREPTIGSLLSTPPNSMCSARIGQLGVTACWYYRPEQRIHLHTTNSGKERSSNRVWPHLFAREHTLRSSIGNFADYPLDDIIEMIDCQFTARHIRDGPRPPVWYPEFLLYVCDPRYDNRKRIFVGVKSWNSCMLEEVYKSADFMPIYLFGAPVLPRRYPGPFLIGGRGTGGLGETGKC